jgi:hypothetical protein
MVSFCGKHGRCHIVIEEKRGKMSVSLGIEHMVVYYPVIYIRIWASPQKLQHGMTLNFGRGPTWALEAFGMIVHVINSNGGHKILQCPLQELASWLVVFYSISM